MKRFLPLAVVCGGLLFVGGCASQNGVSPNAESSGTGLVKQFAAAYLSSRAFDRAKVSLTQGSTQQLERAGQDLRLADANTPQQLQLADAFVTLLVNDANLAQDDASRAAGVARKNLQDEANSRYRAALAFVPTENKVLAQDKRIDAQNLNALGYFLAERGENQADWARAELLTRLAVERWDERYINEPKTDFNKAVMAYEKASGPQDSHAWALFKLGRWDEARTEAESVLSLIASSPVGVPPSFEILYHLAEIYRVSGDANKSMPLYQQALRLKPTEEIRRKMEVRLKVLSGQWREARNPVKSNSFSG